MQQWRRSKGKHVSTLPGTPTQDANEIGPKTNDDKFPDYKPEKDVSVPVIQFENGGVAANIINDPHVWNEFPNQKTTLHRLLFDEKGSGDINFLYKGQFDGRMKYFHIPSNNMDVSLTRCSKYFPTKSTDIDIT